MEARGNGVGEDGSGRERIREWEGEMGGGRREGWWREE